MHTICLYRIFLEAMEVSPGEKKYYIVDSRYLAAELGQSARVLSAEISADSLTQNELDSQKNQIVNAAAQLIEFAAVDLIDDIKFNRAPPYIFTELNYLSLGATESESAETRALPTNTIKQRRRSIKEYLGTRTRNHTVAEAIQRRLINIKPVGEQLKPLSWTEEKVLAYAAVGWTTKEIAEHFKLSDNTIDRHYEEIRKKLNALNMPHSIRRAFEYGLFKVGAPINPSMEPVNEISMIYSNADGNEVRINLDDSREVDLVQKIIAAGGGNISARQAVEMDGTPDKGRLAHFGRAILSLSKKLEQATGQQIIDKSKLRVNGERVNTYFFNFPISVETNGQRKTIPKFTPPETPKGGRPVHKKNPVRMKALTGPEAAPNGAGQILIETVSPSELPPLSDELLQELSPRAPEEIFSNEKVKIAADYLHRNEVLGYWTKVMLWVRFGIPAHGGAAINRGGQRLPLSEVLPYIPSYRGLDLPSASVITSLTPRSLLKLEIKFIRSSSEKFPELLRLEPLLGSQLKELLGNQQA